MSAIPQQQNYYEKYWAEGRSVYSGDNQGYAVNFREWMHDQLKDLAPGSRILEVGCGDGSFTRGLSDYSNNVTAIDISARQVEENRRKHPAISFFQHDVAEPLPFASGAYEVIWCSEVLEHLFSPEFALREMARVMARGGRLLVTVPYHGRFKDVLIALFRWDEHFAPDNPHIRFFTKRTLSNVVRTAGFQNVQTRTCGMDKPLRDLFVPTNILLTARKL